MAAYYNEHDRFAAAWLRELIREGLIADGDVDDRDIRDVAPAELAGFAQCHFFAGIGVWSYALRQSGWSDDRPVWTGSCPCQPFSAAGKRGGTADERHLWPSWFHLIEQCRPAVVFGEQVASKDGLGWLDLVQADLEGAGYAAGAVDLCAAGVGVEWEKSQAGEWLRRAVRDCPDPWIADQLRDFAGWASEHLSEGGNHIRQRLFFVADTCGQGLPLGSFADVGRGTVRDEGSAAAARVLSGRLADDRNSQRGPIDIDREDGRDRQDDRRTQAYGDAGTRGEIRRLGHAEQLGARRDAGTGAEAQGGPVLRPKRDDAGSSSATDRPGPTNGIWRDADWLFCRDGKWRPVEPGTFPLAHGAPARVGRLRGYGNAIVAEAAAAFIQSYLER